MPLMCAKHSTWHRVRASWTPFIPVLVLWGGPLILQNWGAPSLTPLAPAENQIVCRLTRSLQVNVTNLWPAPFWKKNNIIYSIKIQQTGPEAIICPRVRVTDFIFIDQKKKKFFYQKHIKLEKA